MSDIVAIVGESSRRGGPLWPPGRVVERWQAQAPAPTGHGRGITVQAHSVADAPEEINVIGQTVEQASEQVDKFLDNAALAGKLRVRIIHGHGTGALRRGLAAFLTTHPLVARFAAEDADRGGAAITVVELRG